ncbi:unnamed protein product [Lymnaea stagnalis]|uniref:Uncharacterized protein n=1 Tax=Lymnaea stagnalis TaxID=6523 RepID=A0AAV2H0C0_LYMST
MANTSDQFHGYSDDISRLVQKALATSNLDATPTKLRSESKSSRKPSSNQSTESSLSPGQDSFYNLSGHLDRISLSNSDPPKYSDVAGTYDYNGIYSLSGPISKHRPKSLNSQNSLQDSSKLRALPTPRNRNSEKITEQVNVDIHNGYNSQVKKKKTPLDSRVRSHPKPAQQVKSYTNELETGPPYYGSRNKRVKLLTAGLVIAAVIVLVLTLFVILLALGIISPGDSTTDTSRLNAAKVSSSTISPPTGVAITPTSGTAQNRSTSTEKFVTIIWDERTATPTAAPPASPPTTASPGSTNLGPTITEKIFIIFDG